MKRDVATYTIVGALVAVAILLIYSSTFQFTGQVVLEDYTNETDCVNAGYTWEDITNETCTIETIDVNEIGFIDSLGHTLTGPENASNFFVTEAWNITNQSVPVLISAGDYSVNSATGVVTNATSIVYLDVDFNYTYEDETCVDEVIGGQCTGDVCAVDFLELCLDETTCTNVSGYWYNEVCNAEEASCSNTLNLCGETNCVGVGSGFWYGDVCNELECSSDAQCDSAYECSEDGICVEWFADDGEGEEGEESGEVIIDLSPPAPTLVTRLTVTDISDQVINPNQTKQITLSFRNDGETALTSCTFGIVDSSSLVTHENGEKSLNPGQEEEFVFDISIPENTEEGQHSLTAMVTCSQRSSSTMFVVDVVEKKLEFELIDVQRTRDDRVRVIYSLEELAGNNQNVEFVFSLVGANEVEVGMVQVNQSINANSFKEFRTNININETLLPINETTNETLESELTLNVNYDSLIYSSSVQEKVLIGAPIGFAIFGGIGAGSVVILLVVVLALAVVLFVARRMRKSGKTLGSLIKK